MRPGTTLICLLAALAGGCTHRQVIERTAPPEAYARANQTLSNRSGEVMTRSGELYRWENVMLTPDSTFGIPVASGPVRQRPSVPTESVYQATVRSRWRGALDGTLIGVGIGVLLGLVIGPDDYCGSFEPCAESRGEQALLGAASGAIWGMTIGAIRAARFTIEVR
jgi:hypothetical protein